MGWVAVTENAPETVADLDPQRTVFYRTHKGHGNKIHLNDKCHLLPDGDPTESLASAQWDDREICQVCSGRHDIGSASADDDSYSAYRALSDAEPGDLTTGGGEIPDSERRTVSACPPASGRP